MSSSVLIIPCCARDMAEVMDNCRQYAEEVVDEDMSGTPHHHCLPPLVMIRTEDEVIRNAGEWAHVRFDPSYRVERATHVCTCAHA
jgi:hypothetical protein